MSTARMASAAVLQDRTVELEAGGTLETGNQPGGGYLVRVRLPLEPATS
jgi:hypothetical protein